MGRATVPDCLGLLSSQHGKSWVKWDWFNLGHLGKKGDAVGQGYGRSPLLLLPWKRWETIIQRKAWPSQNPESCSICLTRISSTFLTLEVFLRVHLWVLSSLPLGQKNASKCTLLSYVINQKIHNSGNN